MNRIKNKLRSRTGASISFALLLFLVCAVLCSVIITAATAASGRMAQTAEMDQRYYAVTSAAELMKDLINDKIVTVVKVTESTETTTYTNGVAGTPVLNTDSSFETYLISDTPAGEIPNKIAGETTPPDYTNQIDGTTFTATPSLSSIPEDAAYRYYKNKYTNGGSFLTITNPRFTLTFGSGSAPLAVTIEELLEANGNITLTLYNTNGSRFTQKMVFTATVSTVSSTSQSDGTPYDYDNENTTYLLDTTIAETEKTTITWKLTGVEMVSAPMPTLTPTSSS